jgi:predicted O-linked N-acetylglucosamine transferase (SPINDLY family)
MASESPDDLLRAGLECHNRRKWAEAESIYRRLLSAHPGHPDALHLLGMVQFEQGRAEAAISFLNQAIAADPNRANFHSNLGLVLAGLKRYDEAIAALTRALTLRANYPQALNNLGNALRHTGKLVEARAAFGRAIALQPDYAEAHNNLGNALVSLGDYAGAVAEFTVAANLRPAADIFANLGLALNLQKQFVPAAGAFLEALRLRPDYRPALVGLAESYAETDRIDDAIETYRRLLTGGDDASIQIALGNALKSIGRIDDAIAAYRRATEIDTANSAAGSNLVFSMWYSPGADPRSILSAHRAWDEQYAGPLRGSIQALSNPRQADRRLRIGYVSPDFRQHAIAFSLVPLLENHDHGMFEVFGYSSVKNPDWITRRLQGCCDSWRDVAGKGDTDLAGQIRADQIDVLIDLSMHSGGGRPLLFVLKPAPIQVAFMAYPGTTGIGEMDYRMSDPFLDPPHSEGLSSEGLLQLPDSFWCFDPLEDSIGPNDSPALSGGGITFGCLSNYCKVNDAVLSLWSKVLKAIPGSRLLLRCPAGWARHNALRLLEVDSGRVEFVSRQSRQDYLRTYHRIDLTLDPFPYNGHVTSLESLWMGVPVITLIGQTPVGRGGLSLLSNLGMRDFVASDESEFVRIAADAGGDLPGLARLRPELRGRMEKSPLMDGRSFARSVEAAYRMAWATYCAGAGDQPG